MSGIVSLYYQSDHDVHDDEELHAWLCDISQEGFTELPNFGGVFTFYLFSLSIVFQPIGVFSISVPHQCSVSAGFCNKIT